MSGPGNRHFLKLVGEANRKAMEPYIKQTIKEAMDEFKAELLNEITKYNDRMTQAVGVRMRTLEKIMIDKIKLKDEDHLTEVTMSTEDELLGLVEKDKNKNVAEEGNYVRVKVRDPKGEMEEKRWSFTRLATTPYESNNEDLEKSVLGMKVGEIKKTEVNFNNTMLPVELEVINVRTVEQPEMPEVDTELVHNEK